MAPHRCATVVAALALLLVGLPGRAQFAFNSEQRPTGPDPAEEAPKAPAYKTVHGVVQSATGVLPGATVWLRGTRTVVVTNAEGEFELRVPADARLIEVACGYAGLLDEVVRLPPVQALGSVYLLRTSPAPTTR